MADHDAEDRRQIARIAAHTSWAMTGNRTARTAPARAALLARFERQVDPDGLLQAHERARRAEHARKAYFGGLARKSAQARRRDDFSAPGPSGSQPATWPETSLQGTQQAAPESQS